MNIRNDSAHEGHVRQVTARELTCRMKLRADIETANGMLLLRKDTPLNEHLIARIVRFSARQALKPILVAPPQVTGETEFLPGQP